MKTKMFLTFVMGLFFISFASAYSYNNFSLSDLLNNINPSNMILGAVFIISFFFINLSLSKFFKDNSGNPNRSVWIPALIVALFITWETNRRDLNLENLFYDIGISSEVLYTILPLILIAGLIYLFVRFKTKVLFILGGLLVLVSFTDLVYEKDFIGFVGIILIGIGIWLWWRKNKKPKIPRGTAPTNTPQSSSSSSRNPPTPAPSKYSPAFLVKLAKKFKRRAKSTQNPVFNGTFIMFLNKLHRWGYGRNESEVIYNFGITQNDLVNIFNRYGKI